MSLMLTFSDETTLLTRALTEYEDVFSNPNKKVEISTPYDPVHLTHVGFNADTGEFTVCPAQYANPTDQ